MSWNARHSRPRLTLQSRKRECSLHVSVLIVPQYGNWNSSSRRPSCSLLVVNFDHSKLGFADCSVIFFRGLFCKIFLESRCREQELAHRSLGTGALSPGGDALSPTSQAPLSGSGWLSRTFGRLNEVRSTLLTSPGVLAHAPTAGDASQHSSTAVAATGTAASNPRSHIDFSEC